MRTCKQRIKHYRGGTVVFESRFTRNTPKLLSLHCPALRFEIFVS
jgi:hypothetical protein